MTTRRTSWCMGAIFRSALLGPLLSITVFFLKTVWFAYQLG